MRICRHDRSLLLSRDGAEMFAGAARPALRALMAIADGLPRDRAGIRLTGPPALRPILATDGAVGRIAAAALGPEAMPVRAILFDKTAATNWALAWHQDRTICMQARIDVAGFGPWTRKAGMHHVAPPFDLLARMVTMRVHLDSVDGTNAPLLITPGSHRCGRVAEADIAAIVAACGIRDCLAQAGDIWTYATPILHASAAAAVPRRRRVLQIDYAAEMLPGGLAWLGT